LPADCPVSGSLSSVPVGIFESGYRRPRHQEILEDAFFYHTDFLSRDAIVIECIVTIQIDAADAICRRIVNHRDEIWKNRLIHFLRECLSFAFVLLAVPFDSMTEDFVEKYSARTPGQNGGSGVGFDDGSRTQG